MAHIKDPKDVDFVIQSEPLTDEAKQEISRFIKTYKLRTAHRSKQKSVSTPNEKQAARS